MSGGQGCGQSRGPCLACLSILATDSGPLMAQAQWWGMMPTGSRQSLCLALPVLRERRALSWAATPRFLYRLDRH